MAWTLEEAKDRFSALVDAALAHEPQLVTRHGRPSVVVLSVEDDEHLLAIPPAADEAEEIPRAAPAGSSTGAPA